MAAALARTAGDQRQIVNAFRAAGALTGARARRLRDLGLNDGRVVRSMVTATIIRRAGPGRYYLDETVWATRRQLRGRTVLLLLIGIGVVGAITAVYVLAT
jgi:hypothetical protein